MNFSGLPPSNGLSDLHIDIERYYTLKILSHGPTAFGVDWGCTLTQELRFVQLLKICDFKSSFSLNDLGCGYGALLGFLRKRHQRSKIDYLGIDLSPSMIDISKKVWRKYKSSTFINGIACSRLADYSVASGIFNVQQNQPLDLWTHFIEETLLNLHESSRRGFAVNFLAPVSLALLPKQGLYYASSEHWVTYCQKELNLKTELIDNYGLREFTIIARRQK